MPAVIPAPQLGAAPASVSGTQYLLERGPVRAELASLGAALRSLSVSGVTRAERVGTDVVAPMGCGLVLALWPNSGRDAVWIFDIEPQQFNVTEPALGIASHGPLRNTGYRSLERRYDAVTLDALIAPQHGWPFLLDTSVRYALDDDGITVTHAVTNPSGRPAPWAVGAHPYLRVGEVPSERLTVTVTGATRLELDDRLNPVAVHAVGAVQLDADPKGADRAGAVGVDLRAGWPAAGLILNTAYGELANRSSRADVAWLVAPDRTTLWAESAFGWIQAYTPADFPRQDGRGFAIALESTTAPPDALDSRTDLIWHEPGQRWEASWGIRYSEGTTTR